MGRKISLVALSAVLAFTTTHPVVAQESGTFYVELVGPDEVVGEPEQQIYGPVRSNDTLWAIASLNRPAPSISVYQMMFAILKKNPQAFNNGNINSMVNGSLLTLPSAEEALAVSHQDAVNALAPKAPAKTETKTTVTTVTQAPEVKPVPVQTRPSVDAAALEKTQQDLDSLRDRLETRIDELEQLKRQEFDVLKQQMDESSQQMVGLAEVNHRMKMRIQELSDELSSIREELNVNRRNQTQILQLLEKPQVEESQAAQSGGLSDILSSPLNLALIIFIPILLIALIITLLLRRKAKRELEQQDKEMAESTLSLMDEDNDEFSSLFSDNLDAEEGQSEDLNAQFEEDEPDLSVEDSPIEAEHIDDSDDDLEPEIEEASFEEFAAAAEGEISDEIALDESEMAALDAFDSDDLVPSPEQEEQPIAEDPDAVISADDLAAALAMDDIEEDIFNISDDEPEDADELSFEEALKQQQEMEAELAEASEQQTDDFANIDLSEDTDEETVSTASEAATETEQPESSLESLEDDSVVDFPEVEKEAQADDSSIDLEDELVDLSDLDLADPTIDLDAETEALEGLDEAAEQADDADLANEEADLADVELESDPLSEALDESTEQISDDDIDNMFASFGEDAFKEDASTEQDDLPSRSDIEEREFVDIDKLLNEADEETGDDLDPYDSPSLDVDLDTFPEVLPDDEAIDVDVDAELASKLDLARAYLEIDDQDGAKKILQEVLDSDDASLKKEAEQLMARFSS